MSRLWCSRTLHLPQESFVAYSQAQTYSATPLCKTHFPLWALLCDFICLLKIVMILHVVDIH